MSPVLDSTYPRQELSATVDPFLFFFARKFEISPRRDSKSRTNTVNGSIRGLPLDHRGDPYTKKDDP